MKPIDKFILHIVHNWKSELNEAYAPPIMTKLITKFKEEADDLNIEINDEQLKKYIETFDEKFRNKENLKKVFEIIKGKFNSDFETYMWERNERAVNWLRKCGMTEVESNIDKVIKLKYICQ